MIVELLKPVKPFKSNKRIKPKKIFTDSFKKSILWLKCNFYSLFPSFILFLMLDIFINFVIKEESLLIQFITMLMNFSITIALITFLIKKYFNVINTEFKKYLIICLNGFFLLLYSFTVSQLGIIIFSKLRFVGPFIDFIGLIVCVLSIYHILTGGKGNGIKDSIKLFRDNFVFFVKLYFARLFMQIILFVLVSTILQQFITKEEAKVFLPTTVLIVNIIFLPLSYIYISNKKLYGN